MLRPTPYRPARGAFPRPGVFRATAAAVLAAGVVGLTACGSSSPSTTTSAAVVAYQTQANAICTHATAAAQPLYARMVPLEKTKHLPALSDITALDNQQAKLQKDLAALVPPASIKPAVDKMNAEFAAVVARVQQLLKLYGDQSIAYDAPGIDSKLTQATTSLDGQLKALGLTSCV
jgi:predicted component of type VI protein secretion system